ncbi:MAG: hypothetical protein ACI9R3_006186 [Verrucomicrobiales bacterium]|jgi:hypothetical protein
MDRCSIRVMDSTPRQTFNPTLPSGMSGNRTVWHRVLGIICIVFGAAGLMGTVGQDALEEFALQQMEITGRDPAFYQALADAYSGRLMVMNVAAAVVATILIAGGILLLCRKRISAPVLKTWAGLKIALLFAKIPWTASYEKTTIELAYGGALAGEGAEFAASSMRKELVIGIAIGVIWGLILPVVTLAWLSRKKIRDQVAFWN